MSEVHDLMCRLWRGEPLDISTWHDSLLFSFWKGKGDFRDLQQHRGIVILDTLSKVASRMVANRLSQVAEQLCTDTETAYRKGRGCADSYFLLRRLLQEWTSSRPTPQAPASQLYILFVDLSKAFDGVPRSFLWTLLRNRLGVPGHAVSLLERIYSNMQTRVCGPGGRVGEAFEMDTGTASVASTMRSSFGRLWCSLVLHSGRHLEGAWQDSTMCHQVCTVW